MVSHRKSSEKTAWLTSTDKLWELVNAQPSITPAQKAAIKSMYGEVVKTLGHKTGPSDPLERAKAAPKARRDSSQFLRPNVEERTEVDDEHLPFLHLKRKTGTEWAYSQKLTNICEFTE